MDARPSMRFLRESLPPLCRPLLFSLRLAAGDRPPWVLGAKPFPQMRAESFRREQHSDLEPRVQLWAGSFLPAMVLPALPDCSVPVLGLALPVLAASFPRA